MLAKTKPRLDDATQQELILTVKMMKKMLHSAHSLSQCDYVCYFPLGRAASGMLSQRQQHIATRRLFFAGVEATAAGEQSARAAPRVRAINRPCSKPQKPRLALPRVAVEEASRCEPEPWLAAWGSSVGPVGFRYDRADKIAPAITVETTIELEDVIKQRILDEAWARERLLGGVLSCFTGSCGSK